MIEALMALRGISLLAAVTVIAELGDFARFANARQPQLPACPGLVLCPVNTPAASARAAVESPRPATATFRGYKLKQVDLSSCCRKRPQFCSGSRTARHSKSR
ncbi:IS110 family transposase [Paraburkholderia sp. WC7.3b]|uniref:IS110 family transposase n=1 Tax=Paraburkholderia podalyriae TaxID=1938811 RepID=A0ABR7PWS1_9BURK|nr:IS110 family transposase [Paraburkholderia podalyriae]